MEALAASERFVLLASPEAASSKWVNREVDWWRRNRSPELVIIALTGGTLRWSDELGDWDPAVTSLPPAARGMFTAEPLWADLSSVSSFDRLDRANPDLMHSVAKIAAPMRGVEPDLLIGEHITLHRRARRQRVGGVVALSVLLILALTAAAVAFTQRRTAVEQTRIASARALASAAVANLGTRLDVAQLLAAEAYRLDPGAQSRAALFQAMTSSPALARYLDAGAEVSRVVASADGEVVVAGMADGRVLRWASEDTDRRQVADLRGAVRTLSVSADGATVAAADESSAVLWSAARGVRTLDIPVGDARPVVAVSPSGLRTVVHSAAADPADVFNVPGHLAAVDTAGGTTRTVATTSPSGWSEMAAPTDREVVLFDHDYGSWERRTVPALTRSGGGTVGFGVHNSAAAVSPDGRLITYTNGDARLPLWRTREPTPSVTEHQLEAASAGPSPTALAISPDGKRAATASNGTIHVSTIVASGRALGETLALEGNTSINPGVLAFAGDADHLISGTGSSIARWDLRQLSRIGHRTTASVMSPCGGCAPVAVAVDRTATAVAVAGKSGATLGLYRFDEPNGGQSLGFTPGGGAAWSPDGRLLVRGASTDRPLDSPAAALPVGGGSPVTKAVGVSSDGRRVVVVDGANRIETRDATTGELLREPPGTALRTEPEEGEAAVSEDGEFAAVITADGVSVVSTETGETRVVAAPDGAVGVAFVGDRLAVQRSDSRVVDLWDVGAGRVVRTITNDPETRGPFVINNQDTLFAQYRNDGTVVVRDSRTGAAVGSIDIRPPTVGLKVSLAFSRDGAALVAAIEGYEDVGFPGELQRWRLSPEEWRRVACATAGRSLTPAEWKEHAGTTPPTNLDCARR